MKMFSIILLAAFPAIIHARIRHTPEDEAPIVASAAEDSVCLQSTIIFKDDHAEPLLDGTMAIESSDGNTVTFSITQTWKSPDSICWIAPTYAQDGKDMFCNEADKLESVVPNFKQSYTADCLNGNASIDLFVHDGSFKSSSQENYRNCKGWGNDSGIATYKFELSCNGREICEDGSPPSDAVVVESNAESAIIKSEEYTCQLPAGFSKFSVITKGDATISAHNVYSGVAIGGTLSNPQGTSMVIGSQRQEKSFMDRVAQHCGMIFKGGKQIGAHLDTVIDFGHFEWLAQNAEGSSKDGKTVIVMTSGGTFNTYDFCANGQGENNGNTLVIFNTDEKIILTKTPDGRQFGPSVIAPFSRVELDSDAGYLDGFVVADTFATTGSNPSSLQIHGDYFTGECSCKSEPTASPTLGLTAHPTFDPTHGPTSSPTNDPTSIPTSSPTNGPTSSPMAPTQSPTMNPKGTETIPQINTNPVVITSENSGSLGDPHFRTWRDEHFEYHGQCDLVLTRDENFASGLGVEVQIRTKLVRYWSYIKSAAIRIGDDILEVQGSSNPDAAVTDYWMNFEYQGKLKTVGGFPVTFNFKSTNQRIFVVDLSSKFPGQQIKISTYKEFVRVDFQHGTAEAFGNTVGLLGDFKTGKTLARDGFTVLDDFSEFGSEWQVLPAEPMLFHDVSQPQFPQKCIAPEDPRGERRRRLDESSVTELQAEAACASLKDAIERKDCVYDILATQDLEMVGAY